MGIGAHMPDLSNSAVKREEKRGIYPETLFHYDRERDIGDRQRGRTYTFDDMRTLHPRVRYSFLVQE
jgi:hypothetical protein